jgi:hypothetical protein
MTTDAIETQGTVLSIGGGDDSAINIGSSYPAIIPGAMTKVTTAAAHGLSVGDVGKFASVGGMTEINGLTGVVIAVESTTVFWVDINSVGFTAHASAAGTFTPEEWVPVGEPVDFDGPGGSASVIDATHLGSTAREKIMGIPDEGQFTISLNRVFGNTGQKAVLLARSQRARKPFKVEYMDGSTQTFDGFVLQFSSSGGVDDKINGSITIEITGAVTTVAHND